MLFEVGLTVVAAFVDGTYPLVAQNMERASAQWGTPQALTIHRLSVAWWTKG